MYEPRIPPIIRTIVYTVGLGVGFATLLVVGLAAIYTPGETAVRVVAAAGVVGSAVGWLASALGVAYRPTGPRAYLEREAAHRAAEE